MSDSQLSFRATNGEQLVREQAEALPVQQPIDESSATRGAQKLVVDRNKLVAWALGPGSPVVSPGCALRDRQHAASHASRNDTTAIQARPPSTAAAPLLPAVFSRLEKHRPPSATGTAFPAPSRVLPTPPGPMRVSSRLCCSTFRGCASSRSRPTKLVSCAGRLWRRAASSAPTTTPGHYSGQPRSRKLRPRA